MKAETKKQLFKDLFSIACSLGGIAFLLYLMVNMGGEKPKSIYSEVDSAQIRNLESSLEANRRFCQNTSDPSYCKSEEEIKDFFRKRYPSK